MPSYSPGCSTSASPPLIGLSAFVVEDSKAFRWIYQKFLLVLGGLLIPLDFFPAWLQTISLNLPFAWIIYGPARLFVDPSLARLGAVLTQQGIWLAVIAAAPPGCVTVGRSPAWSSTGAEP